jgi:hypothetical protein
MLDNGELARQVEIPEWLKAVPPGMTAFVFYGYDVQPLVRNQEPFVKRRPNGKTVAFVLPTNYNLAAELWVGRSVASRKDQFNRKLGRTIALGRALVPTRPPLPLLHRHIRVAYPIGGSQLAECYKTKTPCVDRTLALDPKAAAELLKAMAEREGWI